MTKPFAILLIISTILSFTYASNQRSLSQAAPASENATGLPILTDLHIDGTAKVFVAGSIPFTLVSEVTWPETPPPSGQSVYYTISVDGQVLANGTEAVSDDGSLVQEMHFGPFATSKQGSQDVIVTLSWDPSFLESSSTTFQGFAVIGGLTVLPPLLAIVLAFLTGDVLLALFVGIWVAAFLVGRYNPASALLRTLDTYITYAFATDYRVQIIMLSWFMSAMVTMLYKAGGGAGLAQLFAKISNTRRGVQMSTFLLGFLMFFDDYSCCLLMGMTMRPLCDKTLISREKLAFIVHSTAAPLASLFPITSWIGFEISLIAEAYDGLIHNGADLTGWETSPFLVFVNSIPSRYYPLFIIVWQARGSIKNEFRTFCLWWLLKSFRANWGSLLLS